MSVIDHLLLEYQPRATRVPGPDEQIPYPFVRDAPDELMVENLVSAGIAAQSLAILSLLRRKQGVQDHISRVRQEPAMAIYIYATSRHRRFGETMVPPEAVTARYLGKFKDAPETTLDDVARSLGTWRKQGELAAFSGLFERLYGTAVDEVTMPLMLSALGESYPLRNRLASRRQFHDWLVAQSESVFGHDRTQRIFSRLR